MKTILVLLILIQVGCASLITRSDLKECEYKCKGKENVSFCRKIDGKLDCQCKK